MMDRHYFENTIALAKKLQSQFKCQKCFGNSSYGDDRIILDCDHLICSDCNKECGGRCCVCDKPSVSHNILLTDELLITKQLQQLLETVDHIKNKDNKKKHNKPVYDESKKHAYIRSNVRVLKQAAPVPSMTTFSEDDSDFESDNKRRKQDEKTPEISPGAKKRANKQKRRSSKDMDTSSLNLKSPEVTARNDTNISHMLTKTPGATSKGSDDDGSPILTRKNNMTTPIRSQRQPHVFKTPVTKSNSKPKVSPKSHKKNKKGESALHVACIKGNINEVATLLETEQNNINQKDNAGWTPLHEASHHGHADIVELLLENGANVNMPGYDNDSPLIDAVKMNQHAAVRVLLENGANIHLRNKFGNTAFELSKSNSLLHKLIKNFNLDNQKTKTSPKNVQHAPPDKVIILSSGSVSWKNTETTANILNGVAVNKVEQHIHPTHLVVSKTTDRTCVRTLKFLYAICHGAWVVQSDWLDECLLRNSWVPEDNYEVQGTDKELIHGGPNRSRLNKTLQYPGLFSCCHFFLQGRFKSPSKESIADFIKLLDGTILSREPKPDNDNVLACTKVPYHADPDSPQYYKTYYILYDDCIATTPSRNVNRGKVKTVPVSWFLSSIAQFQLADYPQ